MSYLGHNLAVMSIESDDGLHMVGVYFCDCQVCKLFRGKGLFLHICIVSSQPSQSLRLAVNEGSKGKNTLRLCGQRRLYGKGEN